MLHRRMSLALALALAASPSSCRDSTTTTSGGSAVDGAQADAGAVTSAVTTTTPHADAGARRELVNLLHATNAELTLSSRVDNPRDFPEHLVDGKPQTAWNGKTGDLHAWIEVKLDPRVRVDSFALTVGFDKGPLFEQNLRIKKVKIERDGLPVREVDLDPRLRTPQRLPVDRDGGTFRITVLETEPGSNPAWKEIVVSELVALGTAPREALLPEPRLPKITIAPGSAPPPARAESLWEVPFEGRTGASIADLCAGWKAEILAFVHREQDAGNGYERYDEKGATCTESKAPAVEGTLPRGWRPLSGANLRFFDGVAVKDDGYLVLRRPDGVVVGGPRYRTSNDIGDSPPPLASRAAVVAGPGAPMLVVATVSLGLPYGAWRSDGTPDPAAAWIAEHAGRVCRFEALAFSCEPGDRTFVPFAARELSGAKKDAFVAAPVVELPTLDPKTGRIRESERVRMR